MCIVGAAAAAGADPAPQKVDPKPFRDRAHVYQDAQGGTYVVVPLAEGVDARLFYGTGTKLYAQRVTSPSRNGDAWSIGVWSPRVTQMQPGEVIRREDGTVIRDCGSETPQVALVERTGAQAAAILTKDEFLTEVLVRRPILAARDDHGTYYYVDALAKQYGGKGHRVFVGKKGAMKALPLLDIADDASGQVFSTKRGELRLVRTEGDEGGKHPLTWISGASHTSLIQLDLDVNSAVIFRDFGIYGFTGNLCEDL
jgi:hypothetical protein